MNSKSSTNPNPLLVAVGSLVFYACVLPILDSMSTYIQSCINVKTGKLQYIAAQDQEEISQIADRVNGNGSVQAIGFHIDSDSGDD